MASVAAALIGLPQTAPAPFEVVNRELGRMLAEWDAQRHAPGLWFTPQRARELSMLLQLGQDELAHPLTNSADAPAQRALYAEHLRRLLPLLQLWRQLLTAAAERLQNEKRHNEGVRSWLNAQV